MSKIGNASVGEIIKEKDGPSDLSVHPGPLERARFGHRPWNHPPQDGFAVNEDEDFED
jgi:hypothetical protein